jgi:hypothetical protein
MVDGERFSLSGGRMARVNITTAGHMIELEEDGVPAEVLAPLALAMWRATRDSKLDLATGVGFGLIERADEFVEVGVPSGPDERRRRSARWCGNN